MIALVTPFATYVIVNIVAYSIVSWTVYNTAKFMKQGNGQTIVSGVVFVIGLLILVLKGVGTDEEEKKDSKNDSKEDTNSDSESDKEGGDNGQDNDDAAITSIETQSLGEFSDFNL